MNSKEVATKAYQVIGSLADQAGLFDDPAVIKALDYFGDIANTGKPERVKEILPWNISGENKTKSQPLDYVKNH